ncbi:sensor histidine kinase [Dactylosporangium sp. CS-033363]|uniref:sensor histidine kinase n=1 Tax=Dactylosporangium sp. CS-033363 TaxID=3239935 RepID=UPI003D90072A
MRAPWLLLLVVPVLCGLPFTRAAGLLVSIAAMAAVAAALRPSLALAAAVVSLLVTVIYRGPPEPPGLWLILEFTPFLVLLVRTTRAGRWTAAPVALAVTVLPLRVTLHQPHSRAEASILVVATAFACAVAATGLGLYLRAGDGRRARALAAARRAQRLELARDLHDLVAHEVTGIVLEAQAAQVAPAADAHERIEAAGQRALAAMDDMVAALRDDAAPVRVHGVADLPDVVARFGPTATLVVEPGVALSAAAGNVAYHVVIEALTNVRRHAPSTAGVVITLTSAGILTVASDMPEMSAMAEPPPEGRERGLGERATPGGSGLAGLRERVAAVGGALSAGARDGRWEVVADLSHSADVPGNGRQQP